MGLFVVGNILDVVVVVGTVTYERVLGVQSTRSDYRLTSGDEIVDCEVLKNLLVEDILEMLKRQCKLENGVVHVLAFRHLSSSNWSGECC